MSDITIDEFELLMLTAYARVPEVMTYDFEGKPAKCRMWGTYALIYELGLATVSEIDDLGPEYIDDLEFLLAIDGPGEGGPLYAFEYGTWTVDDDMCDDPDCGCDGSNEHWSMLNGIHDWFLLGRKFRDFYDKVVQRPECYTPDAVAPHPLTYAAIDGLLDS